MSLIRADFEALDRDDNLAFARERFSIPEGVTYLDGNSLGALPKSTPDRLQDVIRGEWGETLIDAWNNHDWIGKPETVAARIAPLIGAKPGETLIADTVSINIFKLAAGALKMRPGRRVIVSEAGNFPTDLYMLQGLAAFANGNIELRIVERDEVSDTIKDDVALLVLTHTHYKSGELFDMDALTARAHEAGALTLWDLSHSAGALPVDLNASKADLAVGCGYKYLNGGPGAPAFLYIAKRHHERFETPLSGWMGHAAPFEFVDDYKPAPGVRRALCGTPSILALAALEEGLKTFDGVDMADIRAKSQKLGALFLQRVEETCPGVFANAGPADPDQRGSQISLIHDNGYEIMQALIERGVIGDFRAPDILRFGFTPLYLRYSDIFDATRHLGQIMQSGEWREDRFSIRGAVT